MKRALRSVVLWVLNPRPRWWESAWILGIAAALVALRINAALSTDTSGAGYYVGWHVAQLGDGSIVEPDADLPVQSLWMVELKYRVAHGPGRDRVEVETPSFVPIGRTRQPPTPSTEKAIVNWMTTTGIHSSSTGREAPDIDPGFRRAISLLAAGASSEERYTLAYYLLWAGLVAAVGLLLACPVVAYLRAVQGAWYRQQLFRLSRRECPQCGYDARGRPGTRCSECGTDADCAGREAMEMLG